MLSPTLLDGYLKAAAEISRLAVGNAAATAIETTYTKSRTYSQWDWVDGAPYGTRGGISVVHNFPADGEYVFKMAFQHTTTGGVSGSTIRGEQIEISINGDAGGVDGHGSVRQHLRSAGRQPRNGKADRREGGPAARLRGVRPPVRWSRRGPASRRTTGPSSTPRSATRATALRRCRT